ncbi:translocation/assembly module TamB domain-containing protein [Derxia gummosa]|uniref:Translocation/assembly module TamB domain-containing protein n=1 Tax=Derxia gummosa DSM 723 TaxID=1121388 RepID=A0A8B6X5Z2_9BURK|nr:translocation/assembly module TamB domain-containing protein [Derxia gummosa]
MAALPPSDADSESTPAGPPLWRRLLRWIVWPLIALLLLVSGVAWLAGQEFTLRIAAREIAKATGGAITVEGVDGSLFGRLEVHRLRYEDASLAVETRDLRLEWYWLPLKRFYVRELSAAALEIEQKVRSDEPPALPARLALPVTVTVGELRLDSIEYRASTGARTLLGPVHGSAELGPRQHRLHVSEFALYGVRFSADAEIDPTAAPYATQLRAKWLSPGLGPIADIGLDARGSLARLDVQAAASWRRPGGSPIVATTELKLFSDSLQEMFTPIIVLADQVPVEVAAGVDIGLKAPLALEGTLGFDADDNFGGRLKVENRAPGKLEAGRIPVTTLTADFTTHDGARLENARIEVPGGGTLAARAHFDLKQEIELVARGFDPRGLSDYAVPMKLDGPVRLDIDENGLVATTIALRGAGVEYAGKARIEPEQIVIEKLRLGTGAGGLALEGQFGFDGRRPLTLDGHMLGFDASRILVALDPKDSLAGWLRSSLNGRVKLDGVLGMARKGKEPAVPLQLAIDTRFEPSTLSGLPLSGTARGKLNGTGSFAGWSASDVDVALNFAENAVRLSGGLGLGDRKLAVDVNAPRLDRFSALLGEVLAGRATARGTVGGSLAAPDATLNVTSDEFVFGRGEQALRLGTLRGRFAGNRERVEGELSVEHVAALNQHFSGAQVSLAGRPSDHRLSVRARGEGAKPAIQFSADIAAGLRPAASADGHPVWAGQLLRLTNLGQYGMQLAGPARFEVSAERQRFEGLDLLIDDARLQLARVEHSEAGFQTVGSLRRLSFASFVRMYPQAKDWLPRATLAVDGRWDIGTLPAGKLNGTLHVERSDGDLWVTNSPKGALGISRLALDVQARDNRVDSRLGFESARAGRLDAAFATTLADRDGRLAITADAPIDARLSGELKSFIWLTLSADSPVTADGLVTMDATARGSFAQPRLDGELRGGGLVLRLLKPRARLDHGRVAVRFTENRAELREFSFQGRRGSLTGGGAIQFVNQRPTGTLTLRADQLDASNDPNYQLAASGAVEIALAEGAARITGGLRADSASITLGDAFAPKLGNDVVIVSGEESWERQSLAETQAAEARRESLPLTASLRFDLGSNFRVKGYGADAQLGGGIGIDVRPGQPLRANGVVEVLQGSYNAYSQKLVVDQGTISFVGPVDNPNLAIRATRPELPVNVGIEILGTARNPRLRLYSDTAMSDTERLSWIATGRGLDDSSRADLQYLSVAASALMSDNSGVPLTKRVAGAIGFDSISIGNRTPTSAVRGSSLNQQEVAFVSIGKRLSNRLTFTFERALTGIGTFARLRYEVGRKFYVQTTTGDENAIDAFYTFTFD